MLVLTRKKGETIVLGDGTIISVVKVRGSAVRIGIESSQKIVRGELLADQELPEKCRTDAGRRADPGGLAADAA